MLPKLFQKQFLSLSPIWKAYTMGHRIPSSLFTTNAKLLAAYAVSESIKNHFKPPQQLISLFTQAKAQEEENSHMYTARANAFMGLRKPSSNSQAHQYLRCIHDAASAKRELKSDGKILDELVEHFVVKSKNNEMDVLDLIIIGSLDHNESSIKKLVSASLDWSKPELSRIVSAVAQKVQKGTQNISALKVILLKMKDVSKEFNFLSRIMGFEILKPFDNYQKMFPVIGHQYYLVLNWYSVKCLFCTSARSFASNILNFLDKVSHFTKPKMLKYELCRLQILNYLYEELTQVPISKITDLVSSQSGPIIMETLRQKTRNQQNVCADLARKKKPASLKDYRYIIEVTGGLRHSQNVQGAVACIHQFMATPIIIHQNVDLMDALTVCQQVEYKNCKQHASVIEQFLKKKGVKVEPKPNATPMSSQLTSSNQCKVIWQKIKSNQLEDEEKQLLRPVIRQTYLLDNQQRDPNEDFNFVRMFLD